MVDKTLLKTTILLLVSDPIVRSVLKETLEREGYMVVAAGDLGQAVDRLKECMPDLLITRTYVQGLTGHDAGYVSAHEVHEDEDSNPRGLLDDDRLQNREALQGFEVFPKPYTTTVLLQAVKDILGKPRG